MAEPLDPSSSPDLDRPLSGDSLVELNDLDVGDGGEEVTLFFELVGDRDRLVSVVMVGASALIPIPLLDDVSQSFFRRRLFLLTLVQEQLSAKPVELDHLLKKPAGGCCLTGCLGKAVIYPFRRLLRKLLFFLEIKRAVDESTAALAQSWLLALALRRNMWAPGLGLEQTDRLRETIALVCKTQGIKPLELAVASAFRGGRRTLGSFARYLIHGSSEGEEGLELAFESFNEKQSDQVSALIRRLQVEGAKVSQSYLKELALEFEKTWGMMSQDEEL